MMCKRYWTLPTKTVTPPRSRCPRPCCSRRPNSTTYWFICAMQIRSPPRWRRTLGQLIGTQVQVVEAIQIRVFVALLRGELTTAACLGPASIPSVFTDADVARTRASCFADGLAQRSLQ